MNQLSISPDKFEKLSNQEIAKLLSDNNASGFSKIGDAWVLTGAKETPKDTRITKSKFVGKDRLGNLVIKAKVYIGDVFLGNLDIKNKHLQLLKY
jgi:hypothetical protein